LRCTCLAKSATYWQHVHRSGQSCSTTVACIWRANVCALGIQQQQCLQCAFNPLLLPFRGHLQPAWLTITQYCRAFKHHVCTYHVLCWVVLSALQYSHQSKQSVRHILGLKEQYCKISNGPLLQAQYALGTQRWQCSYTLWQMPF